MCYTEKTLNIIGISAFYHDSAACLLKDGQVIAASQEERFTRIRHDPAFPINAIQSCLKIGNLKLSDIDIISFYEKPFIKFERILESLMEYAPASYALAMKALPVWIKDRLWLRKIIWRTLERQIPVAFCSHHEAHAASTFFPSPYESAATLTVDGVGEWSTTTWGVGNGNRLELKAEIRYPHSVGLLYSAFTQYLGFRVNSAEYKVMGLAPYGEPKYTDLIRNHLIEIFPDGSFLLNMEYFSYNTRREMINTRFDALFGQPRRKPETALQNFHADVARSLQEVTEEVMLKLSQHVYLQTKLKNLCLAGGVALNCVANGRILREGPFENLWIQPGAGDSGGAVGAAFIAWHHIHGAPRTRAIMDRQQGSFLGPSYADDEILPELETYQLKYHNLPRKDFLEKTAELLEKQKVVGWFQGRMEFGPRALGNRSIIGDARNPEMQRRMNLKIKFRESFRPFAPSVLSEDTEKYFDLHATSPYMLLTCSVKENVAVQKRAASGNGKNWMSEMLSAIPSQIPAVTHVDGSARVHTVEKNTNLLFYELIEAFKQRTGSSVLINTSFNVRGEPIVCAPRDAVRCFIKTDIEALAIGPYVVVRDEQDQAHLESLRKKLQEEDKFELD